MSIALWRSYRSSSPRFLCSAELLAICGTLICLLLHNLSADLMIVLALFTGLADCSSCPSPVKPARGSQVFAGLVAWLIARTWRIPVCGLGGFALVLLSDSAARAASVARAEADWWSQVSVVLSLIFFVGFLRALFRSWRARQTMNREVLAGKHSLAELALRTVQANRTLVRFAILVPAKDESRVIANTMIRLSRMNYDPSHFSVYVVADARECPRPGEPATAVVASDLADLLNRSLDHPVFHVLEVPDHYDGSRLAAGLPSLASSKGRALNYGLEHLRRLGQLPDLIGVLDADGRLDPDVLIEAAWRHLVDGSRVLQGPVFQITNLDRVDLFGVMAGVELSIYHLSSLAAQLRSRRRYPRFLAGTNYFICPHLLLSVGGWSSQALVEDADLGLRLFCRYHIRADWLPCAELEQTSPSLAVYLKQRHRWALGHLQLLPQIQRASLTGLSKCRLYWQVTRALISCPLTVLLPLLGWVLLLYPPTPWPAPWPVALSLSMVLLSLYTWDDFGRGLRLLNLQSPQPLSGLRVTAYGLALMLMMPCLMVVQLVPRLQALADFLFLPRARLDQLSWYKTERSVEEVGR